MYVCQIIDSIYLRKVYTIYGQMKIVTSKPYKLDRQLLCILKPRDVKIYVKLSTCTAKENNTVDDQ